MNVFTLIQIESLFGWMIIDVKFTTVQWDLGVEM